MLTREDYEGFEALRLSNGSVGLIVIPEVAGKIVSLKHAEGREWLWKNPFLPMRRPVYGESFVQFHDTGGWDECFPSVNPCKLPNGVEIPDHGELVTQAWQVLEATDHQVRMAVEGVRLDYLFERSMTLQEDGFRFEYKVENRSGEAMPFTWCCHPLLSIDGGAHIGLAGSPQGKLTYSTINLPVESEFDWPDLDVYDLSETGAKGIGFKSFIGPLEEGWVRLWKSDGDIRFTFDLNEIQHVALWMNNGGWSGCDSPNYLNLGMEPCIGPFDSLAEAIQAGAAPLIQPFETREWSLGIRIAVG